MPKPKNLVESFMAGLMKDAKGAVDSVTKTAEPSAGTKTTIIPLPQNKEKIETAKSISDQDHINIISGSDQNQNNISIGSDNEQVSSSSVSDTYQGKRSSKEHHRIAVPEGQKRSTKGAPSISLSKSQTLVLFWFKERGQTGVFNKPEIERTLSMPYITIRKAITKLENVGVLKLRYDTCQKIYEYEIDSKINVKPSKSINIGSLSY